MLSFPPNQNASPQTQEAHWPAIVEVEAMLQACAGTDAGDMLDELCDDIIEVCQIRVHNRELIVELVELVVDIVELVVDIVELVVDIVEPVVDFVELVVHVCCQALDLHVDLMKGLMRVETSSLVRDISLSSLARKFST